jgi:hypothetical protein
LHLNLHLRRRGMGLVGGPVALRDFQMPADFAMGLSQTGVAVQQRLISAQCRARIVVLMSDNA